MDRAIFLCTILFLVACTSTSVDTTQTDSYFNQHVNMMQAIPPTENESQVEVRFQALLGDFKLTLTEENLRSLYADELYFNDTFVTLTSIDELVAYLLKTADMIDASVEILDVARSETDYFIKWSMDMKFMARSKEIRSKSIGITLVRFNDKGKVVYHQDYWDSANAFYQHLPIVGGLVQRVRNSMH